MVSAKEPCLWAPHPRFPLFNPPDAAGRRERPIKLVSDLRRPATSRTHRGIDQGVNAGEANQVLLGVTGSG
jgi:hypothetical protein